MKYMAGSEEKIQTAGMTASRIINETPNFGNRWKSIYTYKWAIRARNDSEERFGLLVILDNTNASITATTGKYYKDADVIIKTDDEQQGTEKVLFKH